MIDAVTLRDPMGRDNRAERHEFAGFQVATAGNQGYLNARKCQLNTKVAANGPGTIDTNLHGLAPVGKLLNRPFGACRRDFGVIVADHCL